jgi:phosphoribosyl-dephospho-CoA transferase
MRISEADNPQVHDLLQIDPDLLNAACGAPSWVSHALSVYPWLVVRRRKAPADEVAVGVRGNNRNERWGGFIQKTSIKKIVRPAELLVGMQDPTRILRTPALRTLHNVIERWRELDLPWGPTGSVGFELASGCQVTTETSDLDIAIRAPKRIPIERALLLWERANGLRIKVDIRVETPECGFSLQEFACSSSARILLRYPDGVRLGDDPWRASRKPVETAA